MDEKVLIKSEFNSLLKKILLTAPLVLIPASIILFIALGFDYGKGYWKDSGYYKAFHHVDGQALFLTLFVLACVFAVAGIIMLIVYLAHSQCELTVTENSVKGKTLFGKQVVLPMNMISAYSTRKLFSTIAVATASGITKFSLIKNYAEIGEVLSAEINKRQKFTTNNNVPNASADNKATNEATSSLDELVKLKSLLDTGIITQEEFDAKKKQVLGL